MGQPHALEVTTQVPLFINKTGNKQAMFCFKSW